MQFLKEIREHLTNFETEASEEIHRFIDWLHTKYVEPGAPIVAPPSTNYVQSVASFTPALDAAPVADISTAATPDIAVAVISAADPVEPQVQVTAPAESTAPAVKE